MTDSLILSQREVGNATRIGAKRNAGASRAVPQYLVAGVPTSGFCFGVLNCRRESSCLM